MPDEDSDTISKVSVKLPPFWTADPALWFAQLEAQFSLSKISADDTKFNYVASAIAPEILHVVRDIILNPPATDKYDTIKKRLIDQHAESEESKIRRLLQGIELGDQRPSQLLNRMRSLAGAAVGETLLKSLWLARLPTQMQGILAALSDNLTDLAVTADKINELTACYSINSAASQPIATASQQVNASLEQQILALTKQVNDLSNMIHNNRSRSRGRFENSRRPRSHSRGRRYQEPANGMCFYHTNFGAKAKKCNAGCKFNTEN